MGPWDPNWRPVLWMLDYPELIPVCIVITAFMSIFWFWYFWYKGQ